MISIIINNSTCRIMGLSVRQFDELRRHRMSYQVNPQEAYFSGGHRSKSRYLLDKRGEFPTGLLYIARQYLKEKGLSVKWVDKRKKPGTSFSVRKKAVFEFTPYSEQSLAAKIAGKVGRGIIVMPTGVGKSAVAALIIEELQKRTLLVVPTLNLKKQLTASLSACFGEDSVGSLSQNRDIAVENVDALDPNEELKGYDSVIVDEFHHSGAETYRNLNKKSWKNVYYKFGLTATPFRSQDHEKLLLESVLSRVIYKLPYEVAVKKGYIVPMEAYYVTLPKKEVEGYTWPQVYSELVVNNPGRNEIISWMIKNLAAAGFSTLCLVKEIHHGNQLSESVGCGFANGENEEGQILIRAFSKGKLTALLGTNGIMGEGSDTKPCEYVIIAGLGKSRNAFMQQLGRAFRTYPGKTSCKVILFYDKSHKWTRKHFREQVKILKEEYGVIPVALPYAV